VGIISKGGMVLKVWYKKQSNNGEKQSLTWLCLKYELYFLVTYDELKSIFAERLKMARAKHGMSQIELAKKIGKSKQSIQCWESKKLRDMPKFETLIKLSNLLGFSLIFFLGEKIKDIPAPQEPLKESKAARDSQYDFYRFINEEYNLTKNPDMICEHFEYMKSNPEKCKEIPSKYGKWNVVRQVKKIEYSYSGKSLYFETKEINDMQYTFDLFYPFSYNTNSYRNDFKHDCQNIGQVIVKIEFDKKVPQYCGIVSFTINDNAIYKIVEKTEQYYIEQIRKDRYCKKNPVEIVKERAKNMLPDLIEKLSQLIVTLFACNKIDKHFMIAKEKDIKMIQRECYTRRIHYFVINENEFSNNLFYEYYKGDKYENCRSDEVILKDRHTSIVE